MAYQKSKAKDIVDNKAQLADLVCDTIKRMANVVGSTAGPGGRYVLLERDGMPPQVTKDGVTVAKAIGLPDAAANLIVDSAKEICLNTAKEAGDGTTTAIVLADAIVDNGRSFLAKNPKYNPQRFVNELNKVFKQVITPFIKSQSIPAEDDDMLRFVARISANGDQEIADAVVGAITNAGEDGTVLIEEGQDGNITVDTVDGFVVTTGLKELGQIGPAFINDRANQQLQMSHGHVVLYDGAVTDLKLAGKIEDCVTNGSGYADGSPIIVFAHKFADNVLEKFAKTTKAGITVAPVISPRTGAANSVTHFLYDMAAYTGATVIDPGNIDEMDEDDIGEFTSARMNMYETFIISDIDSEAIENRVEELKAIMSVAHSEFERAFIRAAIAKLTGGIATIFVGGSSDLEIREKKARVEDAVEAVRSAIAEGVIPGAASLHLLISNLLEGHEDKKPSWEVLINALKIPFDRIMTNCGEDPEEILKMYDENGFFAYGKGVPVVFDAEEHLLVDPVKAGIIEPAKVCRVSLGNALSVASLLITLGGLIVVPRDSSMEQQLELAQNSFKQMMGAADE